MYCLAAEFPGVLIAGFGYCSDFRSGELKVEPLQGRVIEAFPRDKIVLWRKLKRSDKKH